MQQDLRVTAQKSGVLAMDANFYYYAWLVVIGGLLWSGSLFGSSSPFQEYELLATPRVRKLSSYRDVGKFSLVSRTVRGMQ